MLGIVYARILLAHAKIGKDTGYGHIQPHDAAGRQ